VPLHQESELFPVIVDTAKAVIHQHFAKGRTVRLRTAKMIKDSSYDYRMFARSGGYTRRALRMLKTVLVYAWFYEATRPLRDAPRVAAAASGAHLAPHASVPIFSTVKDYTRGWFHK